MSQNPFIFGGPIREKSKFFGREQLIRRVMSRLQNLQDSSIIGERRIGKTSLLYHLQEPENVRKHGFDPAQYIFVYFTFQEAGRLSPILFWQRLLQSLSKKVSDNALCAEIDRLASLDEFDPFKIEDLFLLLSDKGLHVVFLLDEFDTVTQATNLDADFFSYLRSLATGQYIGLIFVTSSRQKLSELSHAGIVGSPFFNIFETFYLKPLQPEDVEAVFNALLADTPVTFDQQERAYLTTISGGHPFFLQMAASYLFDAYTMEGLAGEQLRPARLERVEHEFLSQCDQHFAHYWERSTDREKIFLAALASFNREDPKTEAPDMEDMKRAFGEADIAIQILEDRGLVFRESGGYHIFTPAYGRWLIQEITQKRHRTKFDYASWLTQNKPYYGESLDALQEMAQDITGNVNAKYWNLLTEWLLKSQNPQNMLELLKRLSADIKTTPIWRAFV